MRRLFASFIVLALMVLSASASEPWRPGHIYCPDASKSAPKGELPPGTQIVLEDGTKVEAAALAADDPFSKVVALFVKARGGYNTVPTELYTFVYRLNSIDLGSGGREVDIMYGPGKIVGHRLKGVTHVIK